MQFLKPALAAGLLAMEPIHAALLPITNPGFESQAVDDGTYIDNGAPSGWTAYDPQGIIGHNYSSLGVLNPAPPNLYPAGAPEGQNVALVFLWPFTPHESDAGKPAGIQQSLVATLQANTQYTLTVQVGNIAEDPPPPFVAFDLNGFPGYQVQLLAGGSLLAQDDNSLHPAEGTFALSTVQFATGETHPQLGQPITLRLINLNGPSGIEVNFDDVQLDAIAVPEPATWLLLGPAAFLLLGRRRHHDAAARKDYRYSKPCSSNNLSTTVRASLPKSPGPLTTAAKAQVFPPLSR